MFGNPARGPRIVPFQALRKTTDKLPNGHPAFRVTQRFDDVDAYWSKRGKPGVKHGAMDIGNTLCGDEIIAMQPGVVDVIQDFSVPPALGVKITNGARVTEQWHLGRVIVRDGQRVNLGQVIGYNGSTGLDIGGCHTHVKVSLDGGRTWRDPWPLLFQNIRPPVPAKVVYRQLKGPGINIRTGPGTAYPIYASSRTTGIYRGATKLAELRAGMRQGTPKRAADGSLWIAVWLGRAYRYVRSDLLK